MESQSQTVPLTHTHNLLSKHSYWLGRRGKAGESGRTDEDAREFALEQGGFESTLEGIALASEGVSVDFGGDDWSAAVKRITE
jgi:hypothetical protein